MRPRVAVKSRGIPRNASLAALLVVVGSLGSAQPDPRPGTPDDQHDPEESAMRHATGEFEVTILPLALDGPAEDPSFARMSLEKQFHGPLDAIGQGQMLSAQTAVAGSAAYVAIERVTGTLEGREGSFALQHAGTMTRGAPELSVRIVPDSGTGELEGLAGTLGIRIEGGKHFYDLEYTLPER